MRAGCECGSENYVQRISHHRVFGVKFSHFSKQDFMSQIYDVLPPHTCGMQRNRVVRRLFLAKLSHMHKFPWSMKCHTCVLYHVLISPWIAVVDFHDSIGWIFLRNTNSSVNLVIRRSDQGKVLHKRDRMSDWDRLSQTEIVGGETTEAQQWPIQKCFTNQNKSEIIEFKKTFTNQKWMNWWFQFSHAWIWQMLISELFFTNNHSVQK
jgi:hypothetical protein